MKIALYIFFLLTVPATAANAGLIGQVFSPGQPGFVLISLLGITALCGFVSFLLDALQFNGGRFFKMGARLSSALIVLDLMFKVLRKGLEIVTL